MVGIAAYGSWRTRHVRSLNTYLKGSQSTGWGTIGLSVMATQASAITFLSIPGQGFESGIGFVQNYFGLPLALIIVCAVFLPMYRRLGVYTAYEFLGRRFDGKTRLLGAGLFLLQRGLAAGRDHLRARHHSLHGAGLAAGSRHRVHRAPRDRLHRHRRQRSGQPDAEVADGGDLRRHGDGLGRAAGQAARRARLHWRRARCRCPGQVAGGGFSLDPSRRYTLWTGLLGGLFLSLSYFGTDQSQVQRYIGGASLRESRLGLMFNAAPEDPDAVLHPPARRAPVRLLPVRTAPGVLQPVRVATSRAGPGRPRRSAPSKRSTPSPPRTTQKAIRAWLGARDVRGRRRGSRPRAPPWSRPTAAPMRVRAEAKAALLAADPRAKTKDSDYVFITFILDRTSARR